MFNSIPLNYVLWIMISVFSVCWVGGWKKIKQVINTLISSSPYNFCTNWSYSKAIPVIPVMKRKLRTCLFRFCTSSFSCFIFWILNSFFFEGVYDLLQIKNLWIGRSNEADGSWCESCENTRKFPSIFSKKLENND